MSKDDLALFGLILNMFGVILLFFFGFPQPDHSEAIPLELEDNTTFTDGKSVKSLKEKARRRKLIYRTMSSFALILTFIGFLMQAVSIRNGN